MLIVGQFYTFTFLVEKICSSLLWPLIQCLQFISHVKQHQCLIQWRQNFCNVSGPSSCLPHFGSHLLWVLELHVPLYEYWEVDLVVDKGAGKQCIWHYHDMKRIRLIFMRLSTCSLVRQVVSVIFGCPRYGGCNPWILYLLKEPELVMLQCYYRTVLLSLNQCLISQLGNWNILI